MYIIENDIKIEIKNEKKLNPYDRKVVYFLCEKCNKETHVSFRMKDQFKEGYLCKDCKKKKTNKEKYGNENYVNKEKISKSHFNIDNNRREEILKKSKKTKLEKYGNENYTNSKKASETMIEKYGVRTGFQTINNRNAVLESLKKKETIEKRLHTHYFLHPKIDKVKNTKEVSLQLRKQTKFKKYGDENYNNREKAKQTCIKTFGYEHACKNEIILNKIKNSQYIKYGKFAFNTEKQKNTILKNFYNKLISSDRLNNLVKPLFTLEDYIGGKNKKYQWQCCKCGNIFESIICDGIIPRCLNCFPYTTGYSNMEKEVVDWIKSLNIQVDENNRNIINPLELDIYVPSHNLAIEFDGLYWHSELQGKDANYHLDKTNRCIEKGIHLLHIFEDEWLNKQDIVKSIIKNNLGLHDKVVYGRNCIVKDISSKEANEFYDTNHIQGSCTSSINLGLYYQDELVSCLSFAKPRFNKKYDWEITRFANKLNYKIHGSFGKLWKYRPIGSIITYSDKRLFTGSVYKKYMKQLADSKPAYWYVKSGIRYNRVEFQKHKLANSLTIYDTNLTEWENMQLNGYDRIYDCGNWVFEC